MLLTSSDVGFCCAQGRQLLKRRSNFQPGMDNRICPSTHGLTYFVLEAQPLKSLDLALL